MKIWLVNPFDPLPGEPFREGRYATLYRLLSQKGHEVIWWTSDFFHAEKTYKSRKNVCLRSTDIQCIHTPVYRNNIGLGRVMNHRKYAQRFLKAAHERNDLPDVIFASYPPIVSADYALKFARQHGIVCIIDVQDLWVDALCTMIRFPLCKKLVTPWKKITESVFRNADVVVCVAKEFLSRVKAVRNDSDNEYVVHLGVDCALFDSLSRGSTSFRSKGEKKFWVTYCGVGGRSYDLKTVLEAAELLLKNPSIMFFFAGTRDIKRLLADKNLPNCIYEGLLEYDNLVRLLCLSDAGLNPMVKNVYNAFPNKVFDYFAAGLPVINSKTGELEEVLIQHNAGLQYESGNPHSLAEKITWLYDNNGERTEMALNARNLAVERFDRNKTYHKLVSIIEQSK